MLHLIGFSFSPPPPFPEGGKLRVSDDAVVVGAAALEVCQKGVSVFGLPETAFGVEGGASAAIFWDSNVNVVVITHS